MPHDPKPAARIRDPETLRRFRMEHLFEPCDLCGIRQGTEIHHKTFRSQGGDDVEKNCLWICRWCHEDIHAGRLDRYAL
jgi:hypothetical protein